MGMVATKPLRLAHWMDLMDQLLSRNQLFDKEDMSLKGGGWGILTGRIFDRGIVNVRQPPPSTGLIQRDCFSTGFLQQGFFNRVASTELL